VQTLSDVRFSQSLFKGAVSVSYFTVPFKLLKLCGNVGVSECLFSTEGNHGEPGSSVSIVSGYGLGDRAIEFPSPAEAKGFFL
jgi:hypothetical protein